MQEVKQMLETTKAVADFGVLIVIAGIFLYFYITDKRSWQKSQEKQFDRSNEINDKLTNIINNQGSRLDLHEASLDKHSAESTHRFEDLNAKIDKIDGKMETLQATTNELATKEMAEDIKAELKSLKR